MSVQLNMKLKLIVPIAALVALFAGIISTFSQDSTGKAILYYTCPMHPSVKSDKPGSCPYCGMTLQAVYPPDVTSNSVVTNALSGATNSASSTKAKPRPYPLDTCLVDGMKLGSMGPPYVFAYKGQEIKFCCAIADRNSTKTLINT
jgi:Heavy metal binding domain